MSDHYRHYWNTRDDGSKSAPQRGIFTAKNAIGALAMSALVHFMPWAWIQGVVCADKKGLSSQIHRSGFSSPSETCERMRPAQGNAVIDYFAERLDRIISLVISPEWRARDMGIQVDETLDFSMFVSQLTNDLHPGYDFVRTALAKHLSEHDMITLSSALEKLEKNKTHGADQSFFLLLEALKRDAPTQEIRRIVRFFLSQGQYNEVFNEQYVEGSSSSESLVIKAEGVTGMPNVEGRINRMTVVLNPFFHNGIIDILRRKSADGQPFMMDVYYSDKRELSDLTKALGDADIPNVGKYVRFIDTSSLWDFNLQRDWPWIRDNYVMLKDKDGKPLILRPKKHYLIGKINNNAPDVVGFFGDMPVRQASVIFRGGNIRQTKDTVFVGWDEILYNSNESMRGYLSDHFTERGRYPSDLEPKKSDIQWALEHFGREFGKKIVVVGRPKDSAGPQHIYHLDVFFTPLGGRDIALADIDADWMRHIASDLKSQWYRIFPIPLEVAGNAGQNSISYNNVLVERFAGKDGKEVKRVYLPQYADTAHHREEIAKLDAKAVEAWQKTGFDVVTVRMDIENLNMNGSLDCRVNETRE